MPGTSNAASAVELFLLSSREGARAMRNAAPVVELPLLSSREGARATRDGCGRSMNDFQPSMYAHMKIRKLMNLVKFPTDFYAVPTELNGVCRQAVCAWVRSSVLHEIYDYVRLDIEASSFAHRIAQIAHTRHCKLTIFI